MIWIRNGIRATRSMVKDGPMTPPAAAIRERSLQELTLKMIEGRILPCQLDPRRRRMTHRRIILCGRERIAVSIGSKLPHQVTSGDLSYGQRQRCQVWPEIPPTSARQFMASRASMSMMETQ